VFRPFPKFTELAQLGFQCQVCKIEEFLYTNSFYPPHLSLLAGLPEGELKQVELQRGLSSTQTLVQEMTKILCSTQFPVDPWKSGNDGIS